MKKLAIICPARNAAATIPALVDSFLGQTDSDSASLHFVISGADDPTVPAVRRLAELHPDQIFLHIVDVPEGPDGLRKYGISHTEEPYIGFTDADDLMNPDFVSTYVKALDDGADAVDCSCFIDREGKKPKKHAFRKSDRILTREQALKWLIGDTFIRGFLPCKAFRRETVSEFGLKFGPGKIFEDAPMVFEAFHRCKKIAYFERPVYHYFVRKGSFVRSRGQMRAEQHLRSFLALYFLIERLNDMAAMEIFRAGYLRMWGSIWYDLRVSYRCGLTRKEGRAIMRTLKDVVKKGVVDESNPHIIAAKSLLVEQSNGEPAENPLS